MRLTRNKVQRALKARQRKGGWPRHYGTDGPPCQCCAPRVSGKLNRETARARDAAREIREARESEYGR